ncbi:uncharacterized protein [Clinocottus analis]|uniref:uncharacterized protein n=1 Tax=Clinocottus analis TaxID=304258 RepID=UPI0035C10E44
MHIGVCCFLAFGQQLFGSAWSSDCTASPSSPSSEQTTYSLSDDLHVSDVTQSDCEFSWAIHKHVLSDKIDSNPELVVSSSINQLITTKCFDNITFTRNCISEGIGHSVHCKPNCTVVALERSQKRKEIPVTAPVTATATAGATAGVTAGATAVILLALFFCVGLCYKFKHRIFRMFNGSRPKCLYTNVKKQNADPRQADEKVENT